MTVEQEVKMSESGHTPDTSNLWATIQKHSEHLGTVASGLAETRGIITGLEGQLQSLATIQRESIAEQRTDHAHVMQAIQNLSLPKAPQPWAPYAVLALAIVVAFAGVIAWTDAAAKSQVGLRFDASNKADDVLQNDVTILYAKQTDMQNRTVELAFERGKHSQRLEDLALFAQRMDNEIQTRMASAEQRLTAVESSAAANAAVLRIVADTQKINSERIVGAE